MIDLKKKGVANLFIYCKEAEASKKKKKVIVCSSLGSPLGSLLRGFPVG
jgi:hypothetical protein